jgi:hypothetical protein
MYASEIQLEDTFRILLRSQPMKFPRDLACFKVFRFNFDSFLFEYALVLLHHFNYYLKLGSLECGLEPKII